MQMKIFKKSLQLVFSAAKSSQMSQVAWGERSPMFTICCKACVQRKVKYVVTPWDEGEIWVRTSLLSWQSSQWYGEIMHSSDIARIPLSPTMFNIILRKYLFFNWNFSQDKFFCLVWNMFCPLMGVLVLFSCMQAEHEIWLTSGNVSSLFSRALPLNRRHKSRGTTGV